MPDLLFMQHIITGAGARNRTEMDLRPGDFESPASTSFTTPAWICDYMNATAIVKENIVLTPGINFLKY